MAHQAAEGGAGFLGEQLRLGFLVGGLLEFDFDQFMAFQGAVQSADHGLGNSRFAHVNQGLARIGEPAQVSALAPGQHGGGGRRFSFGHGASFLPRELWSRRAGRRQLGLSFVGRVSEGIKGLSD